MLRAGRAVSGVSLLAYFVGTGCSTGEVSAPAPQRESSHTTAKAVLSRALPLAERDWQLLQPLAEKGRLTAVETGFELEQDEKPAHPKRLHDLRVKLAPEATEPVTLAFGNSSYQIGLELLGAAPVSGELEGGKVVYADALESTDLIWTAGDRRAEALLVLRGAKAPQVFSWKVSHPSEVTVTEDGKHGLAIHGPQGLELGRVPRPYALDAKGVRRDAELSLHGEELQVRLDTHGLAYPLLLDPALETSVWEDVSGSLAARTGPVAAFDSSRNFTTLFGGYGGLPAANFNQTWEWNGAAWTQRCTTAPCNTSMPSARSYGAMAYDSGAARHVSVLFGGRDDSSEHPCDTWEWSGTAWTPKSQPNPCDANAALPTGREGTAMAYNAALGQTVMFGGYGSDGANDNALHDVWFWNGTAWSSTCKNCAPSARYGHAMAYDSVRQVVLIYGGHGNAGNAGAGDFWQLKGNNTWQQLCTIAPCSNKTPGPRYDHQMVFDTARGKLVLHGGCTDATCAAKAKDTWEWDGTSWTQTADAGTARRQFAMAYDSSRGRAVAYGGSINGGTYTPLASEYHAYGSSCSADSECDTGYCYDGVCCEVSACPSCQGCDQATPGKCSAITSADDPNSCTGNNTCDAAGKCKKKAGQTCGGAADCASGNCIDNTCCVDSCTTPCHSCANVNGTCTTNVAQYQPDANSSPLCNGNNSCDGAGNCTKLPGQACVLSTECASGKCIDGTCCVSDCGTQCKSCANAAGTCTSNVPANTPDTNSTVTCDGNLACDGAGQCKKKQGQSCGFGPECVTGFCADGVCCDSACTGQCKSCNNAAGTCTSFVPQGAPDANSVPQCGGPNLCDGAGSCKLKLGQTCTKADGTECALGYCVDGRCCESDCTTTCKSCNNAAGTCSTDIAQGTTDTNGSPACSGNNVCDGSGSCKKKNGQSCTNANGSECASGFCAGGVCCNAACNGACNSCATGTCGFAAESSAGTPSCSPFACDGTHATCPTKCTKHEQCASGFYCASGGTCEPDKAQGASCKDDQECTGNKNCVDGVCCESACNTGCKACSTAAKGTGLDGVCDNVLDGLPPHINGACPLGGTVCLQDGLCDGTGVCRAHAPAGKSCGATTCSDSKVTGRVCDGNGFCNDNPTGVDCAPFQCSGGSCGTSCNVKADCATGAYCNAGKTCSPLGTRGDACAADEQCTTGHCAGGVCCDSSCTGACQSCGDVGGSGKCSPLDKGKDGAPTCSPFVCDGASGTCPDTCTDDDGCAPQFFCRVQDNTCQPRVNGTACKADDQCPTQNCVDGVCCESACNGQCEHCGGDGKCVATKGDPVGNRDACTGDDGCRGSCDGKTRDACTGQADSGTACGTPSCTANIEHAGSCGDDGKCKVEDNACDPYVCGETSCKAMCETRDDCQGDLDCVAGTCKALTTSAECNSDNTKSALKDGKLKDCAPFLCNPETGTCREVCGNSEDCGSGAVCNEVSKVCEASPVETPSDDSGCGCRTPGRDSSNGRSGTAAALLLLGAVALRRRNRVTEASRLAG